MAVRLPKRPESPFLGFQAYFEDLSEAEAILEVPHEIFSTFCVLFLLLKNVM